MENLKIEELFELYQQICEEAGLEWTLEGWKFFDQVMFPDYMNYCKSTDSVPNRETFRRNCVLIAFDMIEEAKKQII